jgi:hypothetical protein
MIEYTYIKVYSQVPADMIGDILVVYDWEHSASGVVQQSEHHLVYKLGNPISSSRELNVEKTSMAVGVQFGIVAFDALGESRVGRGGDGTPPLVGDFTAGKDDQVATVIRMLAL